MPHAADAGRAPGRQSGVPGWSQRISDAVMSAAALAALAIFRVVDSTLDIRIYGHEYLAAARRSGRRLLFVVWHGKGLIPVLFFQGAPLVIYTSQPRDGRVGGLSKQVRRFTLASLRHMGYQVLDAATFASESRGVIRFLHMLETGAGGIIAADGPAGPSYRAKPGAAFVAKRAGVSLIPVGAAMRRTIILDSWDHFEIPLPFSAAVLAIGEVISVPEEATEPELTALSRQLETTLNDLTARA
ncbi:MAG: lysophospholipid acyltransferase family protein, partial [Armatimonadota bacterium]